MKEPSRSHKVRVLATIVVVVSTFSFTAGCKKDSSPTGPVESPGMPSVNGHWVGSGKQFIVDAGGWLNSAWAVDFAQGYVTGWDSKFVGTMSYTWNLPAFTQTNRIYVKGTVSTSREITLVDTGGVAVWGPPPPNAPVGTAPLELSAYMTRTACVMSANGDTISYSGRGEVGTEVFVLVRQK